MIDKSKTSFACIWFCKWNKFICLQLWLYCIIILLC